MTNKRRCPRCLKSLSLSKFKKRPDGTYSYCYSCLLSYYHEYNAKRYTSKQARATELAKMRAQYAVKGQVARIERKRKLIAILGGACSICGYARNSAALDFDHIDDGHRDTIEGSPKCIRRNPVKRRIISELLAMNTAAAFALALEEVKLCRLVCSNCHREITFPQHMMPGFQRPAL